jgi:hypothetical protein
VPTLLLRMTHQGHSVTTFTCGFTQPRGNDSGKPPHSCHRSGIANHRCHTGISTHRVHYPQHRPSGYRAAPTGALSRSACASCSHRQESCTYSPRPTRREPAYYRSSGPAVPDTVPAYLPKDDLGKP